MERVRQSKASQRRESEKQAVNSTLRTALDTKDEKQRPRSMVEYGTKHHRKKDVDQNRQSSISSFNGFEKGDTVSKSLKHEYQLLDIAKIEEEFKESSTTVKVESLSTLNFSSSIAKVAPRESRVELLSPPTLVTSEVPYVPWDFSRGMVYDRVKAGPIGALPLSAQEYKLMEDLLYCLVGIDGTYIRALPLAGPHDFQTFAVDESADPALQQLAKKVLMLCSHYSTVTRFVEEKFECAQGTVNHALAAAMETAIKDLIILVTQLEHHLVHLRNLTLHKLWFYVQPALTHMETLASVVTAVSKGKCFGGRTLGVLHEKATSLTGDTRAREICLHLAKAASVPYFDMIARWIYQGQIRDVYKEFLVADGNLVTKEDVSVDNTDNYWNTRYALVPEMVPTFLSPIADKILTTGKYQNVIRQCATSDKCIQPPKERLCYSVNEREYTEKIDSAYRLASRTLLDLLMHNLDLMGRLRSVKQCFLMEQGDFIVQFMDMAEEELSKNIDDIMPTRLELLLQLALSTSGVCVDHYKESIKYQLLEWDLLSQMGNILLSDRAKMDMPMLLISGHEAFTLTYDIEWPLNLVLNTSSLGCYQIIFRYLFYCRHVERMLTRVWLLDRSAERSKFGTRRRDAFSLRHRMLHFVKNLECHSMVEVIEPSWHLFHTQMQEVQTMDEVLKFHTDFVHACMEQCMLTNYRLLEVVYRTLRLCLDFAAYMLNLPEEKEDKPPKGGQLQSVAEEASERSMSFQMKISEFQEEFDSSVSLLRKQILECSEFLHGKSFADMLHRIDFNKFYSNRQHSIAN